MDVLKIKILQAMNEKTLESKVNDFISNPEIKVLKLDFVGSIFYFAVMVTYECQQTDAPKK